MLPEAHAPRPQGSAGERQAACKNTQQLPRRWAEAMDGQLPSQVLRPLYRAYDGRGTATTQLAALDEAEAALRRREADHREWSASVDHSMECRGMEYVDHNDPEQAEAFLSRIDRKALNKRQRMHVAIEVAKLVLAKRRKEFADGD